MKAGMQASGMHKRAHQKGYAMGLDQGRAHPHIYGHAMHA